VGVIDTLGPWVGAVTGAGGLVISLVSLRRSAASDRRDREAIIVVRKIWERQYEDRWPANAGDEDPNPRPFDPDQILVLAGDPTVDKGLVLREADDADDADMDRPGYFSHRVLLEVRNVGRAAATDIILWCSLTGTYLQQFRDGTEERTFDEQSISIEGLAPGSAPYYFQLRNMTGLPIDLELCEVTSSEVKQPIRISGLRTLRMHQRS